MTQVTGILRDESGAILANTTCVVAAVDQLVGQDGGARARRGTVVTTNADGLFDAAILRGVFELVVNVPSPGSPSVTARVAGRMTVGGDTMTLEAALDRNAEPVTPTIYQLTLDAAAAALASQQSAAASSAAAGVASGRLEITALSQLFDFVYADPGAGEQLVAAGDVIVNRTDLASYLVLADDAVSDVPGFVVRVRAVVNLSAPQSVVKYGVDFNAADARPRVQAALDAAGQAGRAGAREVVIRGGAQVRLGFHLNIPSGVRLIMDSDAILIPTGTGTSLIRAYGALPSTAFALTADAPQYADRATVGATNVAEFSVGNFVWLTSTKIIDTSPNRNNLVIAQKARVVAKTSTQLIFDRMLEYNFLTAESATVGVMECPEGIEFHNIGMGSPDAPNYLRGIDARFCDGLKVLGVRGGFNRSAPDPAPEFNVVNSNIVGLKSVSNFEIRSARLTESAFYHVEIDGASHGGSVRDIEGSVCRHVVSANWNGPGEPIGVLVEDVRGERTQLNSCDTHDVGRDLTFRKIRDKGSLSSGFQIRTSNLLLDDYVGEGHAANGIFAYAETDAQQARFKNITVRNAVLRGCGTRAVYSNAPMDIDGLIAENCGLAYAGANPMADAGGVHIPAGSLRNARLTNNRGPAVRMGPVNTNTAIFGRILLDNVLAPQSDEQTVFCAGPSAGFSPFRAMVRDCEAPGYTLANLFKRDGASTAIQGVNTSRLRLSADEMTMTVILVDGEAVISNANIILETIAGTGRLKTQFSVTRTEIRTSTAIGELAATPSNGQLLIRSRRADGSVETADVSRVEVAIL